MSDNLLTRSELKTADKKLNYLNDKVKLELPQKKKKEVKLEDWVESRPKLENLIINLENI